MSDIFAPIRKAIEIRIKPDHRKPIAIVGAGSIVNVAHLPAYKAHKIEVAGIYDLNSETAKSVAKEHGIEKIYASLDEIAADPNVDLVDIAVFPWVQKPIAFQMLDAGKDLLCQKPLSYDLDEAKAIVAHVKKRKRKLAVNQQMRFTESVAAAKAMVDLGWIGDPFEVTWDFNVYTPWEAWDWVTPLDQLDLQQFTIHPLDSTRAILGDPCRVYGTQAREPGQPQKGDTRTISVLEYPDERRAFLRSFHKNRSGDPRAEFRIDGTEGSIRGTIGLMYDYPTGRADTLEVNSRKLPTDGWLHYPVTSRWIPDAFIGPLASLLEAIATDGAPITNGPDNLKTLEIIHALYRSGANHEVVSL